MNSKRNGWHLSIIMKSLILAVFVFSSFIILKPKDFEIIFEERFGGARMDVFFDVKENLKGGYVAVGSTKSRTEGKEDFYIMLTDPQCALLGEKRLGRENKDVAKGVAIARDGGYVIAGYTESPGEGYKGGRDAVVLKLKDDLRDEWFKSGEFSTINDEQFNDVIPVGEDRFLLVGTQKEQLYAVLINGEGLELWKLRWNQYARSEAMAAVHLNNDTILVTGWAGNSKKTLETELIALALSPEGELLWHKTYQTKDKLLIGYDIIEKSDGNIAIAGTTYSKRYQRDGVLLQISNDGDRISHRPYGVPHEDDYFESLAQNYAGEIYLFGRGREQGDKRDNGWVLKVDGQSGERLWQNDKANFLGNEKHDRLHRGIHSNDGSIVMVGSTTRFPRSGEAWIMKMRPEIPNLILCGQEDFDFDASTLHDEDQNNILTFGEKAAVRVTITNSSPHTYYNLAAKTSCPQGEGIVAWLDTLMIGKISGKEQVNLDVPIKLLNPLDPGQLEMQVQLLQMDPNTIGKQVTSWNTVGKPHGLILQYDRVAQPNLVLENAEFEAMSDRGFQRGSHMRLAMNVVNTGNATAQNVIFQHKLPRAVKNLGPWWQNLGDIGPGQRQRVYVEFQPDFLFYGDTLKIGYQVIDSTLTLTASDSSNLLIEEEEILPQPVTRDLLADWLGFSDSTNIVVTDPAFPARLNLYANHSLTSKDITVYVNQQAVVTSEAEMNTYTHDKAYENLYAHQYRYQGRFMLDTGVNEIYLQAKSPAGIFNTDPISVEYNPVKPVLHILSIGVPIRKIKAYAGNDAESFGEIFSEVGNLYFEEIRVNLLNDRSSTVDTKLAYNIGTLKTQYFKGEIKPDDLVLLFISSHATITTPGTFRIKASNFDGFYPDYTSIEYREIIERFLGQINCRKLIFLDVFNERVEENDDKESKEEDMPILSQEFVSMMQNVPNRTPVILACGPSQASFESDKLEKGVFAQAIFEALNQSNLPLIDEDKNNIISTKEFFDQLKRGVMKFAANSEPQTPFFDDPTGETDFEMVQVVAF